MDWNDSEVEVRIGDKNRRRERHPQRPSEESPSQPAPVVGSVWSHDSQRAVLDDMIQRPSDSGGP